MTDEWTYTNAEHTEARKGRFGALLVDGEWAVYHDDFPRYYYTPNNTLTKPRTKTKPYYELRVAWYEVVREFLAWHAAQPAPLAVGDYVRLTGAHWPEHLRWSIHVLPILSTWIINDHGTRYYAGTSGFEFDRITVTADLDDPWNLPMPEVGEWVWVEYLDGSFWNGQVRHVSGNRVTFDEASALFEKHIESSALDWHGGAWVAAWGTYDPAGLTPDEPTTFGYVGYVTDADGDVWDLLRDGEGDFMGVLRSEVVGYQVIKWPDVLELGTFTAVER